jgi:predicted MPP superfamily phosphohydrolase
MDFCLIHLSDFHLRISTQLETNDVLHSLVGDLQSRLHDLDLPDPMIALSGDLAYGGREEEYLIVDEFVDQLKDRLHPRRFAYCGGNHDVNWSLLAPFDPELMNEMVEKRTGLASTRSRYDNQADREALKGCMGPYYEFLAKKGIASSDNLFYIESAEVANLKLNIISLNSAFVFSRKYNYHGYVGKQQLEAAAQAAQKGSRPTFNITLVHHPLEAVVPSSQEETKVGLFSFSDIILNGHVHSPRVSVEYSANMLGRTKQGPPPVISCARCVFDEAKDPDVTSGYSIVGIDFEYERVSSLKVWEVRFDKGKKEWYTNDSTYPMTVKVPSKSGLGELASSTDQVGPKVTDAERKLLAKWKREGEN